VGGLPIIDLVAFLPASCSEFHSLLPQAILYHFTEDKNHGSQLSK